MTEIKNRRHNKIREGGPMILAMTTGKVFINKAEVETRLS
jgi:hypothetical protein